MTTTQAEEGEHCCVLVHVTAPFLAKENDCPLFFASTLSRASALSLHRCHHERTWFELNRVFLEETRPNQKKEMDIFTKNNHRPSTSNLPLEEQRQNRKKQGTPKNKHSPFSFQPTSVSCTVRSYSFLAWTFRARLSLILLSRSVKMLKSF